LKPFLTELISKLVSKDDVTAQFETLKQVIMDQTTKTIEPLLKELNEWKNSGSQTSTQSIMTKLDELKPVLDEIPILKKLVADIRNDISTGGKTLYAKLDALQKLLETAKQSGFVSNPQVLENDPKPLAIENAPKPLAIENAKPLVIENAPKMLAIENAPPSTVGALNELAPIIDSIAALRELITKLNTIKIEDVKALLETYKLGDIPALLAKLQSVLESNTQALGTIKQQLDELKPQIDEIPALKTLVGSIQESMAKGADVSSQLSGLQTMLASYNLDGMNILLEEINSWLKGNTLETQLGEVKETLRTVISKLHEDPSASLKLIQTTIGELLPKLEQIDTSLTEQLATIKEDTSVIKAGVEGLSTNSRTRDEELLAKIAEQTEMIADLKKNLGQLGSNISNTTTATLEGTRFLKHKIHNLKKLVKATHTPESEEDTIKRVLQTYDLNLSEKLAGLQASNKNGKNNVSIARIAELENLVAGLRQRLQEETEHTVSVREKETRIEELEEQISALQRNSVKKNGKVSELTNQSADRQVQIDAKTDEIAKLKQEILDLRTNYDGQLRDAALAEEKLRNEISVLTADSAAIKEKLDEKSFLYDEQKESIALLRKEDAENYKLLSEAKAALAEITAAKNSLEEALKADDAKLVEYSEALNEALQSKNEELAARNAKYKEMSDLFTKEMEDTITSLTAAANTTNLDAATNVAFKAKDAVISQLTKEKDDSLEELAKLKAEVQRLEKSTLNAKTGANSVKGDLTREKALLESEMARIKSELSSATTRIAELEAELLRTKTELGTVNTRKGELEAELEQLKVGKRGADSELYILKARVIDLERELGTLKTLHTPRVAKEQSNWNAYVPPTPNRIQLNPRKTVIDANISKGQTKVSYVPYQGQTQKPSSPIMLDERSWQDSLRQGKGKSISESLGRPDWRGGKTRRSKKINARRTRKQQ
jgi:DNA repair exonuclease SbcCD ATPase subunit